MKDIKDIVKILLFKQYSNQVSYSDVIAIGIAMWIAILGAISCLLASLFINLEK